MLQVDVNGTEADGLALQRRLPALCRDWLAPAIERALDALVPASGWLYVDRLEIDLGTVAWDRLEQDLPQAVAQQIGRAMRGQPQRADSVGVGVCSHHGIVRHQSDRQRAVETMLHFLHTGLLPWSFRIPNGQTLEQVLWRDWLAAKPEDLLVNGADWTNERQVLQQALGDSTACLRLAQQFSAQFVDRLLAGFAPQRYDVVQTIIAALRRMNTSADIDVQVEDWQVFAQQLRVVALSAAEDRTTGDLIARALEMTDGRSAAHLATHLVLLWPDLVKPMDLPERVNTLSIEWHAEVVVLEHHSFDAAGDEPNPSAQVEVANGVYIDHAGVVLLHPFLPRLFETLGIALDDRLIQPERALALLHYLATGQPIAPEYLLGLAKVLCGLPQAEPVARIAPLTTAEMDEGATLLQAVIQHWEALRDTGVDGLRGTFLVRAGKLSQRDDGDWLLQVERQAFDILLDQLPWGIGMVKLPWMPSLLRVEWV